MRVSGACTAFVHDSLSFVNVPRRCCRPGCPHYAVATLTFVYSDSTAVVGPLATAREPHSWDLCVSHASRITAPRGWELVRHAGPLPTHPDEDDELVALADAVREGADRVSHAGAPVHGFTDPYAPVAPLSHGHVHGAGAHATVASSGLLAPPEQRSGPPTWASAGFA